MSTRLLAAGTLALGLLANYTFAAAPSPAAAGATQSVRDTHQRDLPPAPPSVPQPPEAPAAPAAPPPGTATFLLQVGNLKIELHDPRNPQPARPAQTRGAAGMVIEDSGVRMPGLSISDDGVHMPGLSIDDDGIRMPGLTINDDGIHMPGFTMGANGVRGTVDADDRTSPRRIQAGGGYWLSR